MVNLDFFFLLSFGIGFVGDYTNFYFILFLLDYLGLMTLILLTLLASDFTPALLRIERVLSICICIGFCLCSFAICFAYNTLLKLFFFSISLVSILFV